MKFGFCDSTHTSKIFLSKGKFTIPSLFNAPYVLFVTSDKTRLFNDV